MRQSIVNYEIETNSFDFYMKKLELLADEPPKKDAEKAVFLGVSASTFSTWKSRNKVPYQELINVLLQKGVSLDWFFANKGEQYLNAETLKKLSSKSSSSKVSEDIILEAMIYILPEIERAQLPYNDETYAVMIKTYLNFKDRPGVDIKTVLRAVAEANVKE